MTIRSKYVAHSVNELEETTVFALVDGAGDKSQVTKVGVLHAARTTLLADDLQRFHRMLEWLLERLQPIEDGLRAAALESARELPMADLRSLPLKSHGERAFKSGSAFKTRPQK